MRVPGGEILAVLGRDACRRAVRTAEYDRAGHLSARHVERLRRRVDEMIDGLHREVPGHELDDGLEPRHRRADAESGEAVLGDRGVDHALVAEFLQQPLCHLVGALIFRDLLADHEHVLVAAHFLGHGVAQRFAHADRHHLGTGRHVGVGQHCRRRRRSRRRAGGNSNFIDLCAPAFGFGRRRRFRRMLLGGNVHALECAGALAIHQDQRDRRVDCHVLGAFGHEDFSERALVDRLDFHRGLVGLDLGDHVAGLHFLALVLHPLGEVALLHRGRERRHQDFDGHRRPLNAPRRSTAPKDRARGRARRIRRPR